MSPTLLTPERLGAEGLAALEARSGLPTCLIDGVRLRPSERAFLRFIGALGGSCPRLWLGRIAYDPRKILAELASAGLIGGPCRAGGGHQVVALTERGRRVLDLLPLPGERPTPRLCREEGCERPAKAVELCGMHYQRKRSAR